MGTKELAEGSRPWEEGRGVSWPVVSRVRPGILGAEFKAATLGTAWLCPVRLLWDSSFLCVPVLEVPWLQCSASARSDLPSPCDALVPAVLEVLVFGRDAGMAEAWLCSQEPLVRSAELGCTVDEVESLIKRHEAFQKAAVAWEERFSALEKLTAVRATGAGMPHPAAPSPRPLPPEENSSLPIAPASPRCASRVPCCHCSARSPQFPWVALRHRLPRCF